MKQLSLTFCLQINSQVANESGQRPWGLAGRCKRNLFTPTGGCTRGREREREQLTPAHRCTVAACSLGYMPNGQCDNRCRDSSGLVTGPSVVCVCKGARSGRERERGSKTGRAESAAVAGGTIASKVD